ncbi:MAG: YgiQ family radical SAM protein [Lentimicrobiaceae bacterium]|nr:YgiQ family radical SAM protein [Lentimicrobiaceae bacterium]
MQKPLPPIDPDRLPISAWLPVSKKEMEQRGWEQADIIIVSGDAYVDHPSFGTAVIARTLEAAGYKVAILPQPNWRDDWRDFKKLGRPRLFFGISAGCMDSMVNHYTARKRLRSNDAYTPAGQAGFRPDYPTIVYTKILKELYPDVPVVIGGIEASMRRLTHYDYWQDRLRPSFLIESGADLLVYGMGEKPIVEIAQTLENNPKPEACRNILQVAYVEKQKIKESPVPEQDLVLESHERCLQDKRCQAKNFAVIETASNQMRCGRILQKTQAGTVVVNPPFPFEPDSHEIDRSFDLPYTRLPHPRYKNRGEIPAFTMIQNSITLHRGCFGGCSFCTISAHQGKHIHSRSSESVVREITQLVRMPYFKGNLSDLGGPSANMYGMKGKDLSRCARCKKPSCLFPSICHNLNPDHKALLNLYKKAASLPGVKHVFIGSGIRYDMLVPFLKGAEKGKPSPNHAAEYTQWLIENGVSGRLKVAPEHTEAPVLEKMRKMPFSQFEDFKRFFDAHCRRCGLPYQLIPYFISAHPGCTQTDMQRLQEKTRRLGYKLEQVQLFTPTPMTLSSEIYYTGLDPYTLEPVFVEKDLSRRDRQNQCFFWYK